MSTPTVITNAVTIIDHSEVVLNGNLVSDGGSPITQMGFCWNTTGDPTISDTISTVEITSGNFSVGQSSGDLPEGIYYMRAFATNGDGTSYGEETTFSLSEEATQVQLIGQFYDINENLFKVKIYRPEHPADPVYNIKYSDGKQSLTRNHGGGGKDSFENTVIQGQELLYNFYLPRNDVSYIEYLLESKYKDYVVILYKVQEEAEDEIFRGYLKPENLVKRYEQNPPYIEIQLSATDSLVELDYVEFKDSDGELIIGELTILQCIKRALEKISDPGGLDLDFKVQLGTYETTLMSSTECALDKCVVDTRAFVEGELEEKKAISCYQVIERLLKPFNVFFRQENGYYLITNPHELDSYEYLFDWTTLTQQSRTATNNIKDISDSFYFPYIEQQKVHPLKYGYVTHRNSVIADELLSFDWSDWTISNWNSSQDNGGVLDAEATVQSGGMSDEDKPYFTHIDTFYVAEPTKTSYLVLRFTYRVTDWALIFGTLRNAAVPHWKIEIQGPDGKWRNPTYVKIEYLNANYKVEVLSDFVDSYKITESGEYNVKITLHFEGGDALWNMRFDIWHPSIKIYPLTDQAVVQESEKEYAEPETKRRSEGTSVIKSTVSNTRRTRASSNAISTTTSQTGRRSDPIKDRTFKIFQENGYQTFEADLHFADGVSEDVTESGAFKIDDTLTEAWNRYNTSDGISLINAYVANVIDNRQEYKNYLRCTIVDRNHEINLNNILTIQSKNYFILQYFRDYRNGNLEAELIELLTDKLTYEDEIEEVIGSTKFATIDTEVPALVNEGEYRESHGFEVGDVLRYSMNPGYTKAQADTPVHARAVSIVSSVLTDDIFKHISDGHIRSDSELYKALDVKYHLTDHKGEYYFLSPTKAGEICRADELDVYDIEQCVGFVTTKGFKIEIDAKNLERPPYPGVSDMSITGNGMNETPFTFVNDEEEPGNEKVYGTDEEGVKGWKDDWYVTGVSYNSATQIFTFTRNGKPNLQVSLQIFADMSIEGDGSSIFPFALVNDEDNPGALYVYATNALGVKGWWPLYSEEESESESESQSTPIVPGILRDYYVTSMTFNTETRILTLTRSEGLSDLTVEIPGGDAGLSEIPFEWCIILDETNTFTLDIYVTSGYTISKAVLEVDAGTLTDVTVKINSTAVTGISGVTVTTSRGVFTATANNVAVAEDRVSLVVDGASYTGEPVIIRGKIILA